MDRTPDTSHPSGRTIAWLAALLAGVAGPACALLLFGQRGDPASLATVGGPAIAVALMGAGMIGAAAAGRLWIGIGLALLTGGGLIALGRTMGMPPQPGPLATALAMIVASASFAARGKLFARSAGKWGWLVALAVVAGEGAILATALARPEALPGWLLALLPAQWASMALRAALSGLGTAAAVAPLLALAGTAAATLLVARLWPRRWPYLVMFTTWIALSALVWQNPLASPGEPRAQAVSAAAASSAMPGTRIARSPPKSSLIAISPLRSRWSSRRRTRLGEELP